MVIIVETYALRLAFFHLNITLASVGTVKLGFKELLNKEQIGDSEPFPVTNLPVYFVNSEQAGITEQFCDGQEVTYHQV